MVPENQLSIEDAIGTLLEGLPKEVRDFVTGPERSRVALSLSQKYRLHADEAGEFERAYIFMLLGISSPEEFVDTLTKAGIPAESVRGLAKDVNEQVFVPLRRVEQGAQPAASTPLRLPQETRALLPGSGEPVPVQKPQAARPPQIPPPSLIPPPFMAPPQLSTQMLYPAPGTPIYMWPAPAVGQWATPAPVADVPPPPTVAMPETVHVPEPHVRPQTQTSPRQVAPSFPLSPQITTQVQPSDNDPYREPVR